MKRLLVLFCVLTLASAVAGQAKKDWRDMTLEEAVKRLNSSPWSQTQVETDTSEMFYSPTKQGVGSIDLDTLIPGRPVREQASRNNNRADRGALNQAISIDYRIRIFSARPIREALSRVVLARYPEPGPLLVKQWQDFIDRDFGPYIVLTVACQSTDGRILGPPLQAFNTATANTIKNSTYLERSDGKRVYLIDYRPPDQVGLGAKFIFPRFIDKERYLVAPEGHVRFVTEIGTAVKVNVRFDLSKMVFSDRLEY